MVVLGDDTVMKEQGVAVVAIDRVSHIAANIIWNP